MNARDFLKTFFIRCRRCLVCAAPISNDWPSNYCGEPCENKVFPSIKWRK